VVDRDAFHQSPMFATIVQNLVVEPMMLDRQQKSPFEMMPHVVVNAQKIRYRWYATAESAISQEIASPTSQRPAHIVQNLCIVRKRRGT
jgi:hypothetical protein